MSRQKYFMIIIAIVVIIIYQFVSLLTEEYNVTEDYINELKTDIVKLMSVSDNNKNGVTTMLYKVILSEDINYLLAESLGSDEVTKSSNRQLLYETFKNDYELFKEIGINQFHFHLNSCESFLRFHQPERYGDDLKGIRYSVQQVNETGKAIHGFEEGRFMGGYRYVMPLTHEGEVVGSVEFSYNMNSMLKPIELTYDVTPLVIVSESEISRKSYDDTKGIYEIDPFSEFGYLSPDMKKKDIVEELGTTEEKLIILNERLNKKFENSDLSDGIFEYYEVDGELYWAIMEPLIDVAGETIGFIIFYKNDPVLYEMFEHKSVILRNSIIVMALSIVLLYINYRFFSAVKTKATYDSLTKLYNRHAFTETIVDKIENGVVLMIDIDDFKGINDENGHLFGDKVLIAVAEEIKSHIRNNDFAVRWGGEEFAIFLVETDMAVGVKRAEGIRRAIESRFIADQSVTVSIGVCEIRGNYHKSMNNADEALYEAKRNGKNKVTIYNESGLES